MAFLLGLVVIVAALWGFGTCRKRFKIWRAGNWTRVQAAAENLKVTCHDDPRRVAGGGCLIEFDYRYLHEGGAYRNSAHFLSFTKDAAETMAQNLEAKGLAVCYDRANPQRSVFFYDEVWAALDAPVDPQP